MAAKKIAKNGKAKPEKIETFDTAFLPPPCRTLTPARAKQWLKADFGEWQHFAARVAGGGAADESTCIRDSIGYMVAACSRAIESGRPVQLESVELGHPRLFESKSLPSWYGFLVPLAALSAALRNPLEDEEPDREFAEMIGPLAAILGDLRRVVEHGIRIEKERAKQIRATNAELERQHDPENRMHQIEKVRKSLEAERDQLVASVLEVVAGPLEKRIAELKAQEQAIWQKHVAETRLAVVPR